MLGGWGILGFAELLLAELALAVIGLVRLAALEIALLVARLFALASVGSAARLADLIGSHGPGGNRLAGRFIALLVV